VSIEHQGEVVVNVHQRLKAIAKSQPKFKSLANRLVKEKMTPGWFRDYLALDCNFGGKIILLNAYLGMPRLISNVEEQYGSEKSLIRLFKTILAQYPALPDTPMYEWDIKRQPIPSSLARQLGLPRVSGNPLVRDWLFSGRLPAQYANHDLARRLRQQCFFDEEAAARYFVEERGYYRKIFTRYFDSHIDDIWAPNIIYYLYFFVSRYFLAGTRRIEKKIPVELAHIIGIRKNSTLDLLMLIDLLYLGSRNVLSEQAVAATFPKIAVLIRYLKQKRFRKESATFAAVGFLVPENAMLLYRNRQQQIKLSLFLPFFWFNMQSLLGYYNVGPVSHLYRHINVDRYNGLVRKHFARFSRNAVVRVRRVLSKQPKIGPALELRSLINIMIYLDTLARRGCLSGDSKASFNYLEVLPFAARYQFGVEALGQYPQHQELPIGGVKKPHLKAKPRRYTVNEWIEHVLY
jgi:hypothetical protein